MPEKWSTGRKAAGSFCFYMDHSDFKAYRKDTNPIVLWLTVRELVQLERITFRAVYLLYKLFFFVATLNLILSLRIVLNHQHRTITALFTSKYRIKVGVINIPTLDVPIFHLCYISSRLSNCCYP